MDSQEKTKKHPLVVWVLRYVQQAMLRQRNDVFSQTDYQVNELRYEISELRRAVGAQQAEITKLKAQTFNPATYDEKLAQLADRVAELEGWKKGAIATLNTLISIQFNAFEDVDAQHTLATKESQRLARVKQHLKKLCRKESRWDGADLGPLLDIHASEIPDSSQGFN